MNITCKITNLKRGVQAAEKILGRNIALPILSNLLIEAEKNGLKISATNLEIGIIGKIRAKVEQGGKIAVPGRILSGTLNHVMSEDNICLSVKDSTLNLKWTGNKAVIKGFDSSEFPLIPKPDGEPLIILSGHDFQHKLKKVIVCAAEQDARQELTGVYCAFFEKEIIFAATDSFRLSEGRIKLKDDSRGPHYQKFIEKNKFIIIPAKTLNEVIRAITPETETVKIFFGENQIFFEIDETLYVSRLIDGKYPEYNQVVPKTFSSSAILAREQFLNILRLAGIFSDKKTKEVKIKLEKGNKITIEAQSVETGENETEMDAEVEMKEPVQLSFNSRYLIDCISSLEGEKIYMGLNNDFGPVIFREAGEGGKKIGHDFYHVIMPIKS